MVSKKQILQIENWSKKLLGADYDKLDIKAEIDTSLSIWENKRIIKEKAETLFELEKKRIDFKAQELKLEQEESRALRKEEEQAELDFMQSLEKVEKDKTTNIIEEIYYVPKQFAKMVALGNATGFLLWGVGGIGKSYSVIRAFKEVKKDFVYCSGFSSVLDFYTFLYNNKDRHIIFDDVSNLLRNFTILDLLKSALYSTKGKRIVEYKTTSSKLKVPKIFEFTGTITILVNLVRDRNEDLKAVADRILCYELKMNYNTLIKVIFELAKQHYKELKKEERQMIANFIKDNTSPATQNLNLRLLYKIYEIYRYNKRGWEKLSKKIIINDERLIEIQELLKKHNKVKDAEKEWIDNGGSRAGFYRLKKRLGWDLKAEIDLK